jgi:hypothetical protein
VPGSSSGSNRTESEQTSSLGVPLAAHLSVEACLVVPDFVLTGMGYWPLPSGPMAGGPPLVSGVVPFGAELWPGTGRWKRSKSHEQICRPIVFNWAANEGRTASRFQLGSFLMCDKCVELDKKIGRYRIVSSTVGDQLTIDRIKELIADLQAQKATLHPKSLD